MDKLEVFGARKLKGQIIISGSKNASLPILAATILSNKKIHLSNLPKVKDIETMIKLLESVGSKINISKNRNSITIINNKKIKTFAPYNLVKTMRAGILVLGPMLARFGKAKISSVISVPTEIFSSEFKLILLCKNLSYIASFET